MNCRSCGIPVNESVTICRSCIDKKLETSEGKDEYEQLVSSTKVEENFSELLLNPIVITFGVILLFVLILVVATILCPTFTIYQNVVLTSLLIVSTAYLFSYVLLWMALFTENIIVALICFILPISVYYIIVIFNDNERIFKTFIFNIIALVLSVVLSIYFYKISNYTLVEVFDTTFG